MLPKDILELVNSRLPIIARDAEEGSGYYFYHQSGLSSDKWDLLDEELRKYGLATRPIGGAIKLTPEGNEVAAAGLGAYKRYAKKKDRETRDPLRTNQFARWGVIISGGSLLISLGALYVSWLAYKKPDNNATAIQKLQTVRAADTTKLVKITARRDTLVQRQKPATRFDTVRQPTPSQSLPNQQPHEPAPPPKQVPAGRLTQPKRSSGGPNHS